MAASLRPPGCAVQRQALAGAGSARDGRIRGVRPSWCACLVVSQVAGARPEEARAIWLGGRRDRCSTKEGFPGSSKAAARTHAESSAFPWRMAVRTNAYPVGAIGAQPPMRKAVRAAAFRSRQIDVSMLAKGFVRHFLSLTSVAGLPLDCESDILIIVSFLRAALGYGCRAGGAGFHAPAGCFPARGVGGAGGQVGAGSDRTACQVSIRSVVQGQSTRRWSHRFRCPYVRRAGTCRSRNRSSLWAAWRRSPSGWARCLKQATTFEARATTWVKCDVDCPEPRWPPVQHSVLGLHDANLDVGVGAVPGVSQAICPVMALVAISW